MGKLVQVSANTEKKNTTEKTSAPVVAQGSRGRLVQTGTGTAKAGFSTSPVTEVKKTTVTPAAAKQAGVASPMFRQQSATQQTVTPTYQSVIAQNLGKGALQQQEAKSYQSESAFNQHVQDVKEPTVAQRVGNTLKGAAKTYGAGLVSVAGMAQTGSGLQRRDEAEKEIALWDQDIKAQRDVLNDPGSTESERETARTVITNLEARKAAYQQAYGVGGEVERTSDAIYKTADKLADSGTKDINKAKRDLGTVGRLAVDVGVAGAQMGADAVLGLATGGSALPAMFVRSMGGSAQEARRAGATHEQQVNYGFASGALSVATEKIGNAAAPFKKMFGKGFLDDVIERTMQGLGNSAAGKIALSFLEEGGEEAIEDLIQPALQMIYNGKTLGGSYSELEASEILHDFLVGGILGGLGGGVEAIGNRSGNYYDSRTELPSTQTETRSDADIVNGIADRLFARYDSMIGESGRKAIRGSYQEGKDTAEHVKDFIPAYNAGVEGKANPNPTNETAYAGYVAGQNDAKTEARRKTFAQESDGGSGLVYDDYVSRSMDNATADEINTVAKALGVRVRMADGSEVRGGTANGEIVGREIRIAKDAQDPVMQVVGHEWTHRVQDLASEQYMAFRNAIMEIPDVAEAANILHEQYNRMGVEISMDEAMDEAAANYAGEMIANTDVLNEFIRRHSEDRTLLEKLRDAIREIVGKLTGKAKQQAQTAEGLLQQAFEAAGKQAESLQNRQTDGTISETRYAVKGKYWRPNLTQNEWALLNRHMEQEMADSAHTLDEATQWAYANENGNRVFAIYGIGDGTEATPLYVSGGRTAYADYKAFMDAGKRFDYGTDGNRSALNRWFKDRRGKERRSDGGVSDAQGRQSADGHDRVSIVQGEGDRRGSAGNGPQSGSEVNTRFSLKGPVEETDKTQTAERAVGIQFDSNTESASPSRYSLKTWTESSYIQSRADAAKALSEQLGVSVRTAQRYIRNVNGIAKMIADDRTRLDYEASPNRSSFVSNAEYGGSIDFSTICAKRRLMTGTFEGIQQMLPNTVLTAEDVLEIRKMMAERGYQVSCGLCYVEGSRANMGQYTKQFLEQYAQTNPDYLPNMAEMNTATGQERIRLEHPEVYDAYVKFMNALAQRKPKMYQLATEYKGEVLEKFGGRKSAESVAAKNRNGGLRLQSFSDFEIIHLIDSMQVITDMSRVGLAGQAYTKVPDFAYALGNTGLKINLSMIAKGVDSTGHIVFDEVEGMPKADAEALRRKYSANVGTILVVFNDDQLKAALNDSFIDFIIPFHRSQWNKAQYSMMGLPANTKDYTAWQNESYIEPVYNANGKPQRPSNYMPNEYWDFSRSGKENAETYLRMCAANNRKPKFSELLADNGDGSYSLQADGSTDGYWKLLIDFKMYSNSGKGSPQMPVRPLFNMREAKRMLNEYEGGHERFPAAQDVVDDFVKQYKSAHQDTQFSLKGTENAQELAALKRENEELRQRVDHWKGQTRRSDGVRTDSKSVQQAAKKLVKDYSAEIDSSEIAGDLASLYDYIARGGDETGELTYTEARSRADSIAERIAESAIAKDDEVYREYSELRKYLRDTKITLSAEDAAGITDYADFRRGLFGKVNLGKGEHTNVDQVYSELAENYPEFFSETRESNVSDQISRIAEVAGELYNVGEYNPFEGYMGQAVSAISNDIMERFFDLPQAKKTFADVQAEKLDAAKAAGRKAAADAKLAGQMAQGRADTVRLRHTQEALQKARTQQAEKLDALRKKYREKDATRREGQTKRELRAKIVRHSKELSKKLLRPTDKHHIPEDMRLSVAALLNSINQESAYTVDENGKRVYDGSGTPTQRTEAFRALQKQYGEILEGKDENGREMIVDEALVGADGLLEQVIQMGDRRLSELTREELATMWKTVRAVEHSVSTAGKVLSKSKFATTEQMAAAFKTDVSTRRKKLGGNTAISLETPYTFFAHYGETGKALYRMLRNAQDSQEVMARDVAEKAQKVLGGELGADGVKEIFNKVSRGNLREAWRGVRGSAIGKWEAETHNITVENGGELTLTTPQVMELYLLSKRDQALGHLLGGGVYQPEIRSADTGLAKVKRGTQAVFLTEGDIESITGKLTGEQKRVADGLQDLTATTLAKYGNEASMQAYGYRKFTDKNYWPIRSAKEGLHSNIEKDSGNVRSIKNIGMAQQTQQKANNAVELHSVFDTFAAHASDMIDYAAWLAPMEDMNRFFNFQYRNDAGIKTGVTVKGLLDEKGGQGASQYWTKLMGDIQNGIGGKDFEPATGKAAKFVGKFKGASVGANIRVVIQQPTAFFRAAAVLDPQDMAKGMTGGVTKGSGWEKALKHSPIAMRKDVGSFDISSPYTLKERFYGKEGAASKLNDLAGAAAGKADAVTWGKLWNACEWQVKRENPDVRAGSNEFYSAVNEAFTDMIDQTQVVDGILQRSNIMRGRSDLSQQATAFMGEPIMSLNVLLRSYDAFRYEENPAKRNKARKAVGRAATALVVTNVVNALAQSVIDGLRDDDRDKDYWEKFLSAFTGVEGDETGAAELVANVVLNGNVGSNMNIVGQIPFAKDILSIIQGYDVSRPDMEVFTDVIEAGQTFAKSMDGSGTKTRKEATISMLAAASKMFGLPVANIKRDVTALIRTVAQASGSLAYQYEVEKFSYNLENSSNKSRFISILYDALEQGDYTTYEHIRRDLMEQMGLDGESIQSTLKTRYKKKTESEENYSLPQKSLDLLGIRGKYAYDSGEDEEKFSAASLDASAYSKYETQKGETYRTQADKATSSGAFSRLSDEGKDKALGYVESYAEAMALKENSGGQYEITTKWIQNAQEAQKQYRIDPGVFAACKAAASECESLKDKNGETIDLSKGLQIMEMLFQSGLNEQQRTAMYEYLNVPKSIRHWNKARVAEQMAIVRKKAA